MSRLDEIETELQQVKNPPVHLWNPKNEGEIDIVIDAQGFWFHEGKAINRSALVRLFASILRCEGDQYFLVTPVEKLAITVVDVPFIIQQAEYIEKHWIVVTNTGDRIIVSPQNRVELRRYQGQWLPYINIRNELWARVNRSIYYQWADQAISQQCGETEPLYLLSGDYKFAVARL